MNETTQQSRSDFERTREAATTSGDANAQARTDARVADAGGSADASSGSPASKKLGISITQRAIDAASEQIKKRNVPGTSLRVGIRGGGCSGFSYVVEFYDGEPRPRDVVYDMKASDGADVRVVVDKKSLLYLNGATFDWEKTLMRQGFKFINPNEKSSCGCGTSFTV